MQGQTPYQDDITKAADQGTDSVRPHDGQSLVSKGSSLPLNIPVLFRYANRAS